MTTLRPHVDEGYAKLLNSFGNVAAGWHDRRYGKTIQNGECCVKRWHEIFHNLAFEEGHLIATIEACRLAKGSLDVIH
jgi:hypothetical protein